MSTLNSIATQLDSIKTDVVTCHGNLKNNLVAKGVEVLPTDKMSNLIDKVGTIPLGKKWASGTYIFNAPAYENLKNINFHFGSGLEFVPSIVFVKWPSPYKYYIHGLTVDGISGDFFISNLCSSTVAGYGNTYYTSILTINNLTDSGFIINISKYDIGFKDTQTPVYFEWYVFE